MTKKQRIEFYVEGNTMFVDIKLIEAWKKENPLQYAMYYEGFKESFGGGKTYKDHPEWKSKDVFLFDVEACKILKKEDK